MSHDEAVRDAKPRKRTKPKTSGEAGAQRVDPKMATPAKARRKRRGELNDQLVQEMSALRNDLNEMLERYGIRVGGQLSELIQGIEGDEALGQPPRPVTVKTATALLATLRDTNLKPKKGRGKDFVRLQRLTRKLREISGPVGA